MDLRKKEICKHYSAHISHKHQKDKKESPKKTLKSTPNGKQQKKKKEKENLTEIEYSDRDSTSTS